jgi:hypothetical protein
VNEPISVSPEGASLPRSIALGATNVSRPPVTLHGHGLLVARLGVLLFAAICIGFACISIPQDWDRAINMTDVLGDSPSTAKIEQAHDALQSLGLSPRSFALITTAIGLAQGISFYAVGIYLFRRRSNELMPLIVVVFLFAIASSEFPVDLIAMHATHPIQATTGLVIDYAFIMGFVLLVFLFPDGRFTPRWTMGISALLAMSLFNDLLGTQETFKHPSQIMDAIEFGTLIVSAIIAQVYRYRRISGTVERQQTKWFLSGLGFALIAFAFLNIAIVDRGTVRAGCRRTQ